MGRNINIITDIDGNKVVMINSIIFKGKRNVNWSDVERYLRCYVGSFFVIADTQDIVHVGSDFPDEYANSNYTHRLKGASAKAKANAIQGLPELVEISTKKKFQENRKNKHRKDAQYGWYRYESRFALPVLTEEGRVERYNVYRILILIRHAKDRRYYLYDIMEIKKETGKLFQSNDHTQ